MRSVESRLARAAREVRRRAACCPACGGAAAPVLRVRFEGEPARPPGPCPRCGRAPGVVEVVFEAGPDPAPGAAVASRRGVTGEPRP